MTEKNETNKKLRITLVKSMISSPERQTATVRALGLSKINQTVVQQDSPVIQGMLAKISHLVKVEVQD